ncbi:hypothetical protein [Streptomyces sp. NRRL B-1347]|uniref:hypothetical protein n=1 Tax=Streptomyces sp. NRRL B-1347 TaxID=1476877 RepID=UPI0004CC3672|nr:hypothetical protein [Streptomyces sp. NRRL B-1347]
METETKYDALRGQLEEARAFSLYLHAASRALLRENHRLLVERSELRRDRVQEVEDSDPLWRA